MVIVMEVRVSVIVMDIGGGDCCERGADDEGSVPTGYVFLSVPL